MLSNKFAIVSCCLPGKAPAKRLVLRSAVRKVLSTHPAGLQIVPKDISHPEALVT